MKETFGLTNIDNGGLRCKILDLFLIYSSVIAASAITLAFNRRFYYADDTQSYFFGTWYSLGSRIRSKDFSFLSLETWTSGNILVEGLWGTYNPFILVTSLASTFSESANFFSAAVKVLLLMTAATAAYFLSLTLESGRRNAVAIAMLVPLGGFTIYMDSASWANGLFAWVFFLWVWLSIELARRNLWPSWAVVGFLFLLFSVGHPQNGLLGILLIFSYLITDLIRRDWRKARQLILTLVLAVPLLSVIYLPIALSGGVTTRNQTVISSSGFLSPDLQDLLSMTALVPGVELPIYSGNVATVPFFYVAWLLPLLIFGFVSRLRSSPCSYVPIGMFLLISLLLMIGPSEVGPIRYPFRYMPYFAVAVMILAVQGSNDSQWRDLNSASWRHKLPLILLIPIAGFWVTFSDSPDRFPFQILGLLLVVGGLFLVLAINSFEASHWLAIGIIIALTLSFTAFQRYVSPAPQLADFQLPSRISQLQDPLGNLNGQTFIIGNREGAPIPALWQETLLARTWEVNPASVQNSYSVIGFREYVERLGLNHLGETPRITLDVLFEQDPTTGEMLVDLMSIQNIQLWGNTFDGGAYPIPPEGWRVLSQGEYTQLWTRDGIPAPALGSVVYTDPGITSRTLVNNSDVVELSVTNTSDNEGRIILSRLAWPGYSANGARLDEPTQGFILTITVPPGVESHEVTVRFSPPGFLPSLYFGLAFYAGVGLLVLLARRRRTNAKRELEDVRSHSVTE